MRTERRLEPLDNFSARRTGFAVRDRLQELACDARIAHESFMQCTSNALSPAQVILRNLAG
ncbi:MAG: hypothetical protein DWH97_08950 [Planctomycetota bacterium]|nr:MAG: hypothetical protein DWH97_08950 [Planctomycetota bacterium]RLS93993.1 MAG: hypothetical protein DWI12_07505 [Planctomycetota bacterium]